MAGRAPSIYRDLPLGLVNGMLREAIGQRDCAAIAGIVAQWPVNELIVRRILPLEDLPPLTGYLTKPSFVLISNDNGSSSHLVKGPSILDAINLGLLTRQPECALKFIDFTGFEDDHRISIELSRLPLLWMDPSVRNSERVRRHLAAGLCIGISQRCLEAYFTRISTIYAIYDNDISHGDPFAEQKYLDEDVVTIHLDCHLTMHEVAIGFALQKLAPFRFSCNRLLVQRLTQIHLPTYALIHLFDPLTITQFELEDPHLGASSSVVVSSACGWLSILRNLRACSLSACLPPPLSSPPTTVQRHGGEEQYHHRQDNETPMRIDGQQFPVAAPATTSHRKPLFATCSISAYKQLNRALISLSQLQRLGLARCYLNGRLSVLLKGLTQPLEYLNLQDCSLSPDDLDYMVSHWRPLSGLYELNLSRNNLALVPSSILANLIAATCRQPKGRLTCLSIAYSSLSIEQLIWFVGELGRIEETHEQRSPNSTLRVLCLQPFVPPDQHSLQYILDQVVRLSHLHTVRLLPSTYAFEPGLLGQAEERRQCLIRCRSYLAHQCKRPEINIL